MLAKKVVREANHVFQTVNHSGVSEGLIKLMDRYRECAEYTDQKGIELDKLSQAVDAFEVNHTKSNAVLCEGLSVNVFNSPFEIADLIDRHCEKFILGSFRDSSRYAGKVVSTKCRILQDGYPEKSDPKYSFEDDLFLKARKLAGELRKSPLHTVMVNCDNELNEAHKNQWKALCDILDYKPQSLADVGCKADFVLQVDDHELCDCPETMVRLLDSMKSIHKA